MSCVSREQRENCLLAVCLSGRSRRALSHRLLASDSVTWYIMPTADRRFRYMRALAAQKRRASMAGVPPSSIPPVLRRPILTGHSLLPKLWQCITAHAFASAHRHCSVYGCSSSGFSVGVASGMLDWFCSSEDINCACILAMQNACTPLPFKAVQGRCTMPGSARGSLGSRPTHRQITVEHSTPDIQTKQVHAFVLYCTGA